MTAASKGSDRVFPAPAATIAVCGCGRRIAPSEVAAGYTECEVCEGVEAFTGSLEGISVRCEGCGELAGVRRSEKTGGLIADCDCGRQPTADRHGGLRYD